MKPSHITRKTCRLCGSTDLSLALSLQPTPIGDNYLTKERLGEPEEVFSLDLLACAKCGQVQLRDVVSPDLLYSRFPYVTSISVGLPEHFRRFAEKVMNDYEIRAGSLVVEIGSNEGPMLRAFLERGCRVLGVEPAGEIARAATDSGVPTLPKYFTKTLAKEILAEHGPASVLAANNVLANIDDLDDVVAGINVLLASDGILVMESSYWGSVVQQGLIDTIYHEHLSYFSVSPLNDFFLRHGLQVLDAEWNANKGGSIRLTIQRTGGSRPARPAVAERIALEQRERIHQPIAFDSCRKRLDTVTAQLQKMVAGFKQNSLSIAGYGASVGTTTMIYELRLGGAVEWLFDDNPRKFGTCSPGFQIPCVPSEKLEESRPGCVVVFAWRYFDQIRQKHPAFEKGIGRYVLPLPEAKMV